LVKLRRCSSVRWLAIAELLHRPAMPSASKADIALPKLPAHWSVVPLQSGPEPIQC
jgi:hypothetical protein